MRVATYNVKHCASGREAVAAVLGGLDADVVALQEVVTDQARALARSLGMTPVLGPVIRWKGYGNALLFREPPAWSTTIRFRAIRGIERRGCVVAGDGVAFASTHLSVHARERAEQAAELATVLSRWPVVVAAGDLNDLPGGPAVTVLTKRLRDAFAERGSGDGFTFSVESPARRIDYILVSPGVGVRACAVHDGRASDHFPLVADVDVGR